MSTTLVPYLNFDGTCAEAMRFYADIFGGEPEIMRFADSPMPAPPGAEQRTIHASLRAGQVVILASDTLPGMALPVVGNAHLSLGFSDAAEQDRVWERLIEGGDVMMPMAQQFWGRFGGVVDRFGVSWMLSLDAPRG